jgi:putative tricarboxylic transport membrane protein
MKTSKMLTILILASMILVSATFAVAGPYPEKPIEFVTHSAPGGGSDIFARHIANLLEKEKIVTVPVVVVNKSGGSGAVAVAYVAPKKGDAYTIFATSPGIYATLVKGEVKASLADFTPICSLIQDPNVLVVRASAPYKNLKEFIAEAKKKRKGLSLGLSSVGGGDHAIAIRMGEATGAEFNVVSFKQGTEAIMAILGGHIDFGLSSPGETAGQIESGQLRVLATATDKRLPQMPNVPTLKEEGVDVSYTSIRGIFGPKDMPKEAVKYWESAFLKAVETPSWKKYLEKEVVLGAYMGSAEFGKFLEKELPRLRGELIGFGLIKK